MPDLIGAGAGNLNVLAAVELVDAKQVPDLKTLLSVNSGRDLGAGRLCRHHGA